MNTALVALTVLVMSGSLSAHHWFTSVFDASAPVTLAGTLTRVDWKNPHILIALDARREGGRAEAWTIEGMAPSAFRRGAVGRRDFEDAVGRTVVVDVMPARDGSAYGLLRRITFPDGRAVTLLGFQGRSGAR